MASWDDEDFEPEINQPTAITDKWEGEDEDDEDVKDNWDDDDEEVEQTKNTEVPLTKTKKKRRLDEILKEKEEKRRQEMLAKQEQQRLAEEAQRELSPEEAMAEKLKQQRLQEESDLELAKDAFGVTDVLPGQKTIDNFEPSTKEDFSEFSKMISTKLTKYEHKSEYSTFLETLFRDCCVGVDADDIKKISNSLNVLATEKLKLSKAAKGGGKKKGASKKTTLSAGKGVRSDFDYDDNYYDEYEDFM